MTFTAYTAVAAEGARVGFVSCDVCGAAVLIDPRDTISPTKLHEAWHEHLRALLESEDA